jgi:hypothetical protein
MFLYSSDSRSIEQRILLKSLIDKRCVAHPVFAIVFWRQNRDFGGNVSSSSSRRPCSVALVQRCTTGGPRAGSGPQLHLLRPPPSHRFGSIGESFNICLILLVQRKL